MSANAGVAQVDRRDWPLATLHKRPLGPELNKRWWVVAAKFQPV